jgi:cob(I)alamin adenosyltransferase
MSDPKEWKIYTRKGDKGTTGLIGGTIVPKFHPRIECYGTVDELNSVVGMLRDLEACQNHQAFLLKIQQNLFTLESQLAADSEQAAEGLPILSEADPESLEIAIDQMNEGLPSLTNFILPGGHPAVSWAHIARTVCRRAERLIVALDQHEKVSELNLKYMNRLSDYFFVLARRLSFDLKTIEIPWKPRDPNV